MSSVRYTFWNDQDREWINYMGMGQNIKEMNVNRKVTQKLSPGEV